MAKAPGSSGFKKKDLFYLRISLLDLLLGSTISVDKRFLIKAIK